MNLPAADDLRAIFTAAREAGVTKLKITADVIEAELTPRGVLEDIEARAPLRGLPVDPVAAIAAEVRGRPGPARSNGAVDGERPDVLEALANGASLVDQEPTDPTRPA